MHRYYMGIWCLWGPEEGIEFPGTEITDNCELPLGPLEGQPALLTTKLPFQPPIGSVLW